MGPKPAFREDSARVKSYGALFKVINGHLIKALSLGGVDAQYEVVLHFVGFLVDKHN